MGTWGNSCGCTEVDKDTLQIRAAMTCYTPTCTEIALLASQFGFVNWQFFLSIPKSRVLCMKLVALEIHLLSLCFTFSFFSPFAHFAWLNYPWTSPLEYWGLPLPGAWRVCYYQTLSPLVGARRNGLSTAHWNVAVTVALV